MQSCSPSPLQQENRWVRPRASEAVPKRRPYHPSLAWPTLTFHRVWHSKYKTRPPFFVSRELHLRSEEGGTNTVSHRVPLKVEPDITLKRCKARRLVKQATVLIAGSGPKAATDTHHLLSRLSTVGFPHPWPTLWLVWVACLVGPGLSSLRSLGS